MFSSFRLDAHRRPLGRDPNAPPARTRRIAEPFRLVDPVREDELEPDPLAPDAEKSLTVMGVDLGQAVDPAAAAKIRVRHYPERFCGPRYPFIDVCWLKVWPLGYDYAGLIDDVLDRGAQVIVPDYGGVGRGWVDFLHKRIAERPGLRPCVRPVQTVSSDARQRVHRDRRRRQYAVVPKTELVTALNIAQQQGLIALPEDDPLVDRLMVEMRDFRMIYSAAAHGKMSFDHRGRGRVKHHGDLVCALSLAVHYVGQARRELAVY